MTTPKPPLAAMLVFLTVSNMIGVYASLAFLLFLPVPNENRELVSMMLGNILGFAAGIMTYHFGSTKEAADKNHVISTQAETARTIATAAASGGIGSEGMVLKTGEAATTTPTPDGAVIEKGKTDEAP